MRAGVRGLQLAVGIMTAMAGPESTDQTEVEWQFDATGLAAASRWLGAAAVPGYTVTPGPTKHLRDTYYDTADWRLHHAGFTCRVRDRGGGAELTLKSMADPSEAIRTRREITEMLPGAGAIAAASGPCASLIRLAAGPHELRPLFELRTDRQTFRLGDAGGDLGEIALDHTAVDRAGGAPARLDRVEVEVHAGAVERARRFVGVLVATAGLVPAVASKFETALAAGGLQVAPSHPDVGPTEIRPGMPAAEVAFAILRRQFGAFLANEASTRLGEDIEGLHDMRVAARRQRAAMSAFAPYLPPPMARLRMELGHVAAALGAVRDLDVQIERMGEWREGFAEQEAHAFDAIERMLVARRDVARRRMLRVLDSRRYEQFVARYAARLRRGPARSFAAGRVPILAVAPDLLEKRYRRVRKLGDPITPASPAAAYHLLRIEAKKLRYALEFVGPIYGKPAIEFSARVAALQDVLGLHQDAEVAIEMLRETAARNPHRLGPATLLAMGAIAERYRKHAAELRAQFPSVYRPIGGREWRRLRATVEAKRPAGQ